MKTILVTGGNGQLGNCLQDLTVEFPQYTFLFTDVDTLDICDKVAVAHYVKENKVNYIVNCAAYTAVDRAEDEELMATKINWDAVLYLGEAAAQNGAKVIHISTDYVFDGTNYTPYIESDNTSPVSVYGRTKLAGEQALQQVCPDAVIIRTSWLYSEHGNNFVKTMLRLGKEREELRVIFDQVGTPTYAGDLARAILKVVEKGESGNFIPGIYHFSNEGVCSWYDFAIKIMAMVGLATKVYPIETKEYPTRAARPHYSVLNKTKIKLDYNVEIPHWETSLAVCLKKINA